MKKGIRILIAALLSASFILMPFSFSVYADDVFIPINVPTYAISAYRYWSTVFNKDWNYIDNDIDQSTITGTINTNSTSNNVTLTLKDPYRVQSVLVFPYISGSCTLPIPTTWNNQIGLQVPANGSLGIYFATYRSDGLNWTASYWENLSFVFNNLSRTFTRDNFTQSSFFTSGMDFHKIVISNDNDYSIDFNIYFNKTFTDTNLTFHILPFYIGNNKNVPDDVRVLYGGEFGVTVINPTQDELIVNGTSDSQASTSAADQSNQSLGTSISNLSTIEDQYNQDLNTQLNQIDFTDHITTQQGFLSSSSWVINTFNTLIANNPFTWLIVIVSIFYVFKRFN